MLDYTSFDSAQKGPNLLITGAVHGNEACGTIAIRQWIDLLNSNKETILCGTVRFIPICNPRAFEKSERFIEENLNRVITPSNTPKSYEHSLAQDIITHLDWADYHLDSPTPQMIFLLLFVSVTINIYWISFQPLHPYLTS